MRETRQSGSEGGVAFGPSLPLSVTASRCALLLEAYHSRFAILAALLHSRRMTDMFHRKQQSTCGLLFFTLFFAVTCSCAWSQPAAIRRPAEDVNDPEVRVRPGLQPNTNLLFSGWGVTPSGYHVPISDLALKLVIAPDRKTVAAVNAGFQDTGLTLLDLATRQVKQFLALTQAWNGLAFSRDGRRIFVSGGDSGQIHVFSYSKGKATVQRAVKPSSDATDVTRTFLAGIAVHPKSGKVHVCNEGNPEVW